MLNKLFLQVSEAAVVVLEVAIQHGLSGHSAAVRALRGAEPPLPPGERAWPFPCKRASARRSFRARFLWTSPLKIRLALVNLPKALSIGIGPRIFNAAPDGSLHSGFPILGHSGTTPRTESRG